MGVDLFGKQVQDTYDAIIKVGDNNTLTSTAKRLSDGRGTDAPIWLSTTKMGIGVTPDLNYTVTINGSLKATDIDTTTLQFLGGTGTQGTLSWNTDEETVDIIQNGATLQVGQEIHVHVKNQSGAGIPDGTPVYVTGTLGSSSRLTVAPFIADGSIDGKYFLGITTEDIPNGEDGKVTTFGKIRGLDTSAYSEGDTLYVSDTTAGAFTTTAPTSPSLVFEIAIVINVSATVGTIFVRTGLVTSSGGSGTTSDNLIIENLSPSISLIDTSPSPSGGRVDLTNVNTDFLIQVDPDNVANSSTIQFEIDGSEVMRLDTTGELGIGTTNPQRILHLSTPDGPTVMRLSDAGATIDEEVNAYLEFYRGDNTNRVGYIGFGSAANENITYNNQTTGGDHVFATNAENNALVVSASGNVGINANIPTGWDSNYSALHIGGSGAIWSTKTGDDDFQIGANTYWNGSSYVYINDGASNRIIFNNGNISFQTAPIGTAGDTFAFNIGMYIEEGGNVGIGTSSPDTILHLAEVAPIITFEDTTDGSIADILHNGGGMLFRVDRNNIRSISRFIFEIDGDEKMRLDDNGNLGIGTTANASSKLHVKDGDGAEIRKEDTTSTTFGVLRFVGDASTYEKGLIAYNSGNAFDADALHLFNSAGDIVFRTDDSGGTGADRIRIDGSDGSVTINQTLYLEANDSLAFEGGKHWITYNDGGGNFNIRVGHYDNPSGIEETTEAGYVLHDEWSQSLGLRQFLVSDVSTAVGDLQGTDWNWNLQLQYDYQTVILYWEGDARLATTSTGIQVFGNIDFSGSLIIGNGESIASDAGAQLITTNSGETWTVRNGGGSDPILTLQDSLTNVLTTFDVNGYLGVGTETPNKPIEISKLNDATLRLNYNSTSSNDAEDYYGGVEFYTDRTNFSGPNVSAYVRAIHTRSGTGHTNSDAGLIFGTSTATNDVTAVERMRIESATGYIGVGTSSPSAKLEIGGTGTLFKVSGAASREFFIDTTNPDHLKKNQNLVLHADPSNSHADTKMTFDIDGDTKMMIDSDGRVGIGTESFSSNLHVEGSGNVVVRIVSSTDEFSQIQFGDSVDVNVGRITYDHSVNDMLFYVADSEVVRFTSTAGGSIGIQETNPQRPLHITTPNGPTVIRLSDNNATIDEQVNAYLEFYRGSDTNRVGYIGFASSLNEDITYNNQTTGGYHDFYTNAGSSFQVRANGDTIALNDFYVGGTGASKITPDGNDCYIEGQLEAAGTAGSYIHQLSLGNTSPTGNSGEINTSGNIITSGKIQLGSSADSAYLSGSSKLSADGYIMCKGIINEPETGTGPAGIVFGIGATYVDDYISLVTGGVTAIQINNSQVVEINGRLNANSTVFFYDPVTFNTDITFDVSSYEFILNRGASTAVGLEWQASGAVQWRQYHYSNGDFSFYNVNGNDFLIELCNVGIGKSPTEKLDVDGTIQADSNIKIGGSSVGSPKLGFYQSTTEKAYVQYADIGDELTLQSDGLFTVITNGSNRTITVDASNNVGINDSTPSHALDVTGNGRFTENLFLGQYLYHNGDTNTYIRFTGDRVRMFAGGVEMIDCVEGAVDYVDIADTVRVDKTNNYLECTGDIIGYTSTTISDANKKENVKLIDSPIDKIKQINGYTFDWKHNGKSSAGVIAQEVEKILPEAVQKREGSITSEEPYLTVEYNGLIGLLIETVKEQQEQIEDLKAEINNLKGLF